MLLPLFVSTTIFGVGVTIIDILGLLGSQFGESSDDADGGDNTGDTDSDSDSEADAGLKAAIEAEKQTIEMLKKKYEAEIITPALAQRDKSILKAKAEAAIMIGKAQAEIDQLEYTLKILEQKDTMGKEAYIIENFERLVTPFAETLSLFPAKKISVITGVEGKHDPISAIHPNAIDDEKNKLIADAISSAFNLSTARQKKMVKEPLHTTKEKDVIKIRKKPEHEKKDDVAEKKEE